jgi:hypothetical protein
MKRKYAKEFIAELFNNQGGADTSALSFGQTQQQAW